MDEHRAGPQAPERLEAGDFVGGSRVDALRAWTMNGIVAGVARQQRDTLSANLAACADGPPLEPKGVRPSERLTTRTGKRRFNSR